MWVVSIFVRKPRIAPDKYVNVYNEWSNMVYIEGSLFYEKLLSTQYAAKKAGLA